MTPNVTTQDTLPPPPLPTETRSHIADLMSRMQDHVEHLYVDLLACLTHARRVHPATGHPMPALAGDAHEREALVAALAELRQGLREFEQCRAAVLADRPPAPTGSAQGQG